MNSKERMMCALNHEKPDRLPVTIHQWQDYHLRTYMHGMSDLEACRACGLDAAITYARMQEGTDRGSEWRISEKRSEKDSYTAIDYIVETPGGVLTWQDGSNPMTTWVTQYLIKRPEDIDLLEKYMPVPRLDRSGAEKKYSTVGNDGILRSFVWGKQGGCWQDACELFGTENLIMAVFDDPEWVHRFLKILLEKKLRYIAESLAGAPFDLIEMGGGAASNTVISPAIHEEFCLPYDRVIHDAVKALGFKVVYHTCGGMSKITHLLVQNHCDACETLSPSGVGGDITTDKIARQVYQDLFPHVSLIGGMDQFNILETGTKEQIQAEVARLFSIYGENGGYMLSASDHFFNAPAENLCWYAQAAHQCTY